MYQNLVSKNPGDSQSVMGVAPRRSSLTSVSLRSSSRSAIVKPIDFTSTRWRLRSTSRACECDGFFALNAITSSCTFWPGTSSDGIVPNRSHVHS